MSGELTPTHSQQAGATSFIEKVKQAQPALTPVAHPWLACFRAEGPLYRAFAWTPLRWLGNMSYSYYLIHGLALKAGGHGTGEILCFHLRRRLLAGGNQRMFNRLQYSCCRITRTENDDGKVGHRRCLRLFHLSIQPQKVIKHHQGPE